MANLTKRQYEILYFISRYQKEQGYSPTLAEIGQTLGISRMTVHEHVAKMTAKGVLSTVRDESRSITILQPALLESKEEEGLPLVGLIAAGLPIEAVEQQERFSLPELLPTGKDCYVLRVKGDSMIEDGICDGDYVIVEKSETAANGQTVVAIINDNEATLKRFYREGDSFRLQPANASMEPIYINTVDVRGVVVGIYRKL